MVHAGNFEVLDDDETANVIEINFYADENPDAEIDADDVVEIVKEFDEDACRA